MCYLWDILNLCFRRNKRILPLELFLRQNFLQSQFLWKPLSSLCKQFFINLSIFVSVSLWPPIYFFGAFSQRLDHRPGVWLLETCEFTFWDWDWRAIMTIHSYCPLTACLDSSELGSFHFPWTHLYSKKWQEMPHYLHRFHFFPQNFKTVFAN